MRTVDERVSHLEGRMMEQSTILLSLQAAIASMDQRMQDGFRRSDQRLDAKFDALDAKMTKQFHWLVGILFTVLSALVVASVFRR